MRIELVSTPKGEVARCFLQDEGPLSGAADFLELMSNCSSETIALEKAAFHKDFFELRSGIAGEILQKVSNYRRRLVVLGDFENLPSRALRDFIYESNRTGQVVFAPSLEAALELLRD